MSIEFLQLLIDFGLFQLVWLVQLVIYPVFFYMEEDALKEWNKVFKRRFLLLGLPLMMAQLVLVVYNLIMNNNQIYFISALLVALAFMITFLKILPINGQIAKSKDSMSLRRELMKANKIRVVAWTMVFMLDLFILI